MNQILEISALGNDLFAEFKCECPSEKYRDDPILSKHIKTTIKLSGYNDSYFFNEVNKVPRMLECKCGKEYKYQWFGYGVEVESTN